MIIRSAEFKFSSQKISQIPEDGIPEFAFIGRSNVGKSSLINMVTNNSSLAKVSSTPGKTQLINHFLINDEWYLVDLPGYGYARVSKKMKSKFAGLISEYVLKSKKMILLFVLIDSRLEPQKIDLEFINMLGENGVPFAIIFTKSDKQSQRDTNANIKKFASALEQTWEELPAMFCTSSVKKTGRDDVLSYVGECLTGIDK